ncbi:FUSC family protein [Pseudodonghicola xiamenensis]|uniref:Fusaric acid resistance protein n=1 Tax=Pseudodonghicola xiamenensis TaxID=337702 RepID=A0A8J3HCB8_9RHOB|nr:FUSC family protein [Pseudodonghicola xiamenensis]GHH03041.1 fusaric acid resistance protein [Pseudodonghicola xiamenensis]
MTRWLTEIGFDTPRMLYAGRTALTACLAFLVAWALGLEHPQWAGMTVWAATQPTKGQVLEKSLFRILGTISGTIAGVLLVLSMQIHPAFLVIGLTLWVGICTWFGNLQRGFVAYSTMLAGYTAAMVSLLDSAHPDHVFALGADRFATVLTGVLAAALVGYLFAPRINANGLRRQIRDLLADLLDRAAAPHGAVRDDSGQALLSRLAAAEEGLDPHAAGSIRSRREVRATRALLIAAIPVLLRRRNGADIAPDRLTAEELNRAARALRADDLPCAQAALSAAANTATSGPAPALAGLLETLGTALAQWSHPIAPSSPEPALPIVLHRDWVGAREAMVRAMGGLGLFGALWLVTGWSMGGYMMLGLSIMLSLMSMMESPTQFLRSVAIGQFYGVLGALAARWLIWPLADSEFQIILLTLPFILFGTLLVGHRSTVAASFDYNMVMLLLLQPHYPLTGNFGTSVAMGGAVVAAPLLAMLAYRFIYPAGIRRRLDTLLAAMLRDLADLAADPSALTNREVWRARFYHRTLRLVRLSDRYARANVEAMGASLALLNLGHAAMRCHEIEADPASSDSQRRAARAALGRLQTLRETPQRAEKALTHLGQRLSDEDADLVHRAAHGVTVLTPAFQTV